MAGSEIQEKPILFNSEMVQAVLAGKKTQTRRAIKSTPVHVQLHEGEFVEFHTSTLDPMYSNPIKCPYGKAGDQLWVRETFGYVWPEGRLNGLIDDGTDFGRVVTSDDCDVVYRASDPDHEWMGENGESVTKWRPSIFMPRKLSRIQLLVESVRVEELLSITEDDAAAEGIERHSGPYILDFAKLWDSINAKRGFSWNANPWVWVVEFSVLEVK